MDYEKIRKQCQAFARSRGFPQDAEDFASDVIIYLIERPECHGLFIERRFVDFLRKHYGRKGCPGGDAKSRARLGSGAVSPEDVASNPPSRQDSVKIGDRIAVIPGKEKHRYAAVEILVHERTELDVAAELGVTESRVSQMVSAFKKRIQETIILDECLPEYLEDEERQTLSIRWIQL